MTTLDPYFGTHDGDLQIYAGVLVIGSGTFTSFKDFQADFTGSYEFGGGLIVGASQFAPRRRKAAKMPGRLLIR
jgi:hypothetical protein